MTVVIIVFKYSVLLLATSELFWLLVVLGIYLIGALKRIQYAKESNRIESNRHIVPMLIFAAVSYGGNFYFLYNQTYL